jgi:energy-coupling factor transport system substrate-specific component
MNDSAVGLKAYRTLDLVTIATLGVAFGVIYWGWDKIYEPISAVLTLAHPTTVGLVGGVWLIAGVVGGLVVRKPGAALATELVAASMELILPGGNQWGVSALNSGLWQGLGAELVFAVFIYRRFGMAVAALAGIGAATLESIYEWGAYWADWDLPYKLAYLGFFAISGVVIAGIGGTFLVRALARAGVLDSFGAGREVVAEV